MTLDQRQRVLTGLVSGSVVFGVAAVVATRVALALLPAGLVVLLAIAWAMAPRGIVVDSSELRILRRAWSPVRVPLSTLASARPIDSLGAGTLRVFGVGGFFGSYGLFRSATIGGRFHLFATRGGPAVVLRRKDGALPIVITPDDIPGTLRAIHPGE
jgi:hypothetical protein